MASLNSDGSGSGVSALEPFCYLCHAQQTKGTVAHPLIAMGDSLLSIMELSVLPPPSISKYLSFRQDPS